MKINFTKKEYSKLIEMIDMADWVIFAHKTEDQPADRPYQELSQKIYSYAKDFACEDKIMHDRDSNKYYPTQFFDSESPHRKYIDEFEEDNFWEDLIFKLTDRDVINSVGLDQYEEMDSDERIHLLTSQENKWAKEIFEHGLSRFKIDDQKKT